MAYQSVIEKIEDRYFKASDVCGLPYVPFEDRRAAIVTLRRAELKIHSIQERECDGRGWGPGVWFGEWPNRGYEPVWNEADTAKAERLTEAAYKRAEDAAKVLGGVLVRGSGDVRGNALQVEFPRPYQPNYPFTLYFGD